MPRWCNTCKPRPAPAPSSTPAAERTPAMRYDKPLPKIDPLNQPFWDAARAGKLVVQTCRACGDAHFPPSPVCPECLSTDQAWREASGRGTLESWIEMHRAYWDGFRDALPYS